MPEYPGGMKALMDFIGKNIVFPQSAKDDPKFTGCRLFVRFVVTKSGGIGDIKIIRSCAGCVACDAEAIRVVKTMPAWKPGMLENKPVNVYYTLPVDFR